MTVSDTTYRHVMRPRRPAVPTNHNGPVGDLWNDLMHNGLAGSVTSAGWPNTITTTGTGNGLGQQYISNMYAELTRARDHSRPRLLPLETRPESHKPTGELRLEGLADQLVRIVCEREREMGVTAEGVDLARAVRLLVGLALFELEQMRDEIARLKHAQEQDAAAGGAKG